MKKNRFFKLLFNSVSYYLWILLIFSLVSLIYDKYIALAESLVLFVLVLIYNILGYKNKSKLLKYIKSDTFGAEISRGMPLKYFPMPTAILDYSGLVVWGNEAFSKLVGYDKIYPININEYIPGLDIENILSNNLSASISYNDNNYNLFGNIINTHIKSDYPDIILYFNDSTEFESLKVKYEDEKFVTGVAVIDNYDEIMLNISNADKPKLVASIEEIFQDYFQNINGIIRKYEKDRFYFHFEKCYLNKLEADKFNIIDKIREINVGNKVSPTISMGIGLGGEKMSDNENFAFSALDMALGRGGDQVIVKENEEYHFYGGRSGGVEKHSRVKSRIVAHALKGLAENVDKIFIMGHKRADIDVLGAAMGLYSAFKNTNKKIYIVIGKENQTVEKFISGLEYEQRNIFINKHDCLEYIDSTSMVIVVDTHIVSLVEQPELLKLTNKIVIIDHHRKSTDFISNAILTYHEPYASSASELVTEVIQYIIEDNKIDKNTAEALYAGIYLDTKGFNFKTGVRTFEAAAYLRRNDVDTIKIKKLFQIDLKTFMSKCDILESVKELKKSVAIATCNKTTDNDMPTIVAQATDELLNIENITSSFVLCDMGDGDVIISARSLGDTNVQIIMEKLGGGGHMTIAGAQLKDTTLSDAVDLLTQAIEECI